MDQLVDVRPTSLAFWFDALFAEPPSDPPCADYASVRAKPLAKPERCESLTREDELELIRAYHEDGDLDALDRLVGAHRPMVVRLARRFARGNPRKLAAFVEYGMLGLMEAAAPPRPSLTKKGAMVGFDPSKYRFSAYARSYAEAMMRTATPDWEPPQHVVDSKMEFDAWAKTPIPVEIEEAVKDRPREDCELSFAQEMAAAELGQHQFHDIWRDTKQEAAQPRVDPTKRFEQIRYWRALFGLTSVLDYDPEEQESVVYHAASPQPAGVAVLWCEQPEPRTKEALRRKTRWTEDEYAAKDKHYAGYWGKLHSFLFVAKEGMEGWGDEEGLDPIESDQAEFMVATLLRNHAFKGELYRLPKSVLQKRWKMGCKRTGKIIPYKFNQGLGQFDKYGRRLPDYHVGFGGKVTVKRHGPFIPFLSASIYLMRREIRSYLILLAAGLHMNTQRRFE